MLPAAGRTHGCQGLHGFSFAPGLDQLVIVDGDTLGLFVLQFRFRGARLVQPVGFVLLGVELGTALALDAGACEPLANCGLSLPWPKTRRSLARTTTDYCPCCDGGVQDVGRRERRP